MTLRVNVRHPQGTIPVMLACVTVLLSWFLKGWPHMLFIIEIAIAYVLGRVLYDMLAVWIEDHTRSGPPAPRVPPQA